MIAAVLLMQMNTSEATSASGYVIGGIIALFITGYLVYSLIKPEKF